MERTYRRDKGTETFSSRVLTTIEERKLLRCFWSVKRALARRLAAALRERIPAEERNDPLKLAAFIRERLQRRRWRDRRTQELVAQYEHYKHQLASANIRLAAQLSKRFRSYGVPYTDLFHEAVCGLLHAIDRFDLNFETRLATYATWWIRQSLQHAVAQQSHVVSLSPHHLQQLGRWQREAEARAHAGDVLSSADKAPGVRAAERDRRKRLQAVARAPVSIDKQLDDSAEFSLAQTLTRDDEEVGRHQLETGELLGSLLHHLLPRERTVLALRYGLTGDSPLTLSEIGSVLSVSKERVRQIQNRAIGKLRTAAADAGLNDTLLAVR